MIVRILTEGQFEVPDEAVGDLNRLDETLSQAVERDDEGAFVDALQALIGAIRSSDRPWPSTICVLPTP